jgi:hypothetical protein
MHDKDKPENRAPFAPHPQLGLFGERIEVERWLGEGERLSGIFGARVAAAVAAAKRAFFRDPGVVSRFIEDACEIGMASDGPCIFEGSLTLYAAYLEWARGRGNDPVTLTAFGRELSHLGFPMQKRGRGRRKFRAGLRLKPPHPPQTH